MDPKDINQTNFCNKKVDNVVSNDIKKYIIDDMKLRTGITPTSRYAKIFNPNYSKNFKNPLRLASTNLPPAKPILAIPPSAKP